MAPTLSTSRWSGGVQDAFTSSVGTSPTSSQANRAGNHGKRILEQVAIVSQALARLGAEIKEIRIEPLEGRLDYSKLFSEILLYEFNQILGDQYRSTTNAAELFGPIVTNNIDVGSKVTKEQYEGRIRERPAIIAEVKQAFRDVDALLTPALPTTAPDALFAVPERVPTATSWPFDVATRVMVAVPLPAKRLPWSQRSRRSRPPPSLHSIWFASAELSHRPYPRQPGATTTCR